MPRHGATALGSCGPEPPRSGASIDRFFTVFLSLRLLVGGGVGGARDAGISHLDGTSVRTHPDTTDRLVRPVGIKVCDRGVKGVVVATGVAVSHLRVHSIGPSGDQRPNGVCFASFGDLDGVFRGDALFFSLGVAARGGEPSVVRHKSKNTPPPAYMPVAWCCKKRAARSNSGASRHENARVRDDGSPARPGAIPLFSPVAVRVHARPARG